LTCRILACLVFLAGCSRVPPAPSPNESIADGGLSQKAMERLQAEIFGKATWTTAADLWASPPVVVAKRMSSEPDRAGMWAETWDVSRWGKVTPYALTFTPSSNGAVDVRVGPPSISPHTPAVTTADVPTPPPAPDPTSVVAQQELTRQLVLVLNQRLAYSRPQMSPAAREQAANAIARRIIQKTPVLTPEDIAKARTMSF